MCSVKHYTSLSWIEIESSTPVSTIVSYQKYIFSVCYSLKEKIESQSTANDVVNCFSHKNVTDFSKVNRTPDIMTAVHSGLKLKDVLLTKTSINLIMHHM